MPRKRFDIGATVGWGEVVVLHEDEIEIDLPLVQALLDRSFPDLAGRHLRRLSTSGSSNALFRLGDDLLVRMPRQPGGSETIAKEARWLPQIAPALPVAVPEVLSVGDPGLGYPEHWAVVHWITGQTPDVPPTPGVSTDALARDLAGVVTALGGLAVPEDAAIDTTLRSYRGEPLAAMDASTRRNLADCRGLPGLDLDLNACLGLWERAVALTDAGEAPRPAWLHGDLFAENLLLREGHLAAVLDFGGLAVGDPTVDLVAAWEMLDHCGREVFRSILGVDERTWLRGRAWALAIAVMTFPYYWHTMPGRCATRLAMAHTVLADVATLP